MATASMEKIEKHNFEIGIYALKKLFERKKLSAMHEKIMN